MSSIPIAFLLEELASTDGDAMGTASSTANYSMENTYQYVHGRIDPGVEGNLSLVEGLPREERARVLGNDKLLMDMAAEDAETVVTGATSSRSSMAMGEENRTCYLTQIPSELINLIFSFLRPFELARMSVVCRSLSTLTDSDLLWQRHVQDNVPGVIIKKPYPCKTFRELYKAHDPHWFLPKYKVWFNDFQFTGKIILTRYDLRRGCIDGYRLVAERPAPTFSHWEGDDQVVVHSFEPKCKLHLDQPVVQLNALSLESLISSSGRTSTAYRFNAETPMRLNQRYNQGVFSNFLLSRAVEERPGMDLWPPRTIPDMQRVRAQSQQNFVGMGHKPQKRSEVCETTFRIRRWMEMQAGPYVPGLHLGEEVYTYSTLDSKLYTPTADKPFRGIWVGDYSGHGCEFLLMHQPDDEEPFDEASVAQGGDETEGEWEERKREERMYRGRLEAIKLTGDPNIPRGEITFSANDIGRGGFVRRAEDSQFKGARIVRSQGQIANRGFRNDTYIATQLIMISPNRMAQYWVQFGHISFFERVDINRFLDPTEDNVCTS